MGIIPMEVSQQTTPQRVCLLMGGETPFECGQTKSLLSISSRDLNRRERSHKGSE
jgi:hypothetical protein